MRSIQQVVIQRAEGLIGHYTMEKVTYAGDYAEERGNAWLRGIAQTAPDGPHLGCYDKTDVWVTLSNDQQYAFRFDVMHASLPANDTDIRQHVRDWFVYNCRPEELPHIAADPRRLDYARRQTTPEQRAMAASLVALLDADLPAPATRKEVCR